MPDYRKMVEELFLAPARAYMAQSPKAPPSMGLLGQIHNAIDPVGLLGGYGGLTAMALPPGAPNGKMPSMTKTGRAKPGGEVAESNNYFYKGGQFLPSTNLPPGTFRRGGKLVKTGKREIEPYKWEVQPTPESRPIYALASAYTKKHPETGKLVWAEGAGGRGFRDSKGDPITPETKSGWADLTYGDLVEMYNQGMRWLEVPPKS